MKNLEQSILRLKSEGKSYNEIARELKCSKGTVSYHCGTGQKDRSRSRAFINRESINKRKNSKRDFIIEFSWRYKRLCGCANCGNKDPRVLEYDHINRSTKITTVAQMLVDRYSIKTLKEEIRKCQVLCANCHKIKTHSEFNYFKI